MVEYTKLGMVGAGSMGSMMTQLFAEAGLQVSLFDVNEDNVKSAVKAAHQNTKIADNVKGFTEHKAFMRSLGDAGGRLFLFSITHGSPADSVLGDIEEYLKEGDIILDGGNEWYLNSERRMKDLKEKKGVAYVGVGVSGGYQSARRGPSLSPGGDPRALDKVLPLLEKVAAKDAQGRPCVRKIGPGGSGHYVKMVHNGIEQGMMGALCEAWGILRFQLGLELDEIGDMFKQWNKEGELRNNFLIDIGADICTRRHPDDNSKHVLCEVLDKVVQDADDTEGTGVWSVMEAARCHISAPTIAAAHFFRIASADRKQRLNVAANIKLSSHHDSKKESIDSARFREDLRQAVYAAFLASYVQGLNLLARQSKDSNWNVSLDDCVQIWRAGCIIASIGIADLLTPVVSSIPSALNLLENASIAAEFTRTFPSLRRVVAWAAQADAYVPSLGATLEWVKYIGGEKLPTMFMEAELDYFGAHGYDKWSEGPGQVKKGKHHFEWKPA